MADISRIKLGLYPNNFYQVKRNNGYFDHDDILYRASGTVNESSLMHRKYATNLEFDVNEFKGEDGNYDYKAMLQFVDENPGILEKFVKETKEKFKDKEQIEIINDILKGLIKEHEDDDLLLLNCISNLLFALNSDEYNIVKEYVSLIEILPVYSVRCSFDLYKIIGNKTRLVPLLYIKENGKLNYYIWDEKGEFSSISDKEILDRIDSGVYHSSKNNSLKLSPLYRYILPGIRVPFKTLEEETAAVFAKKK